MHQILWILIPFFFTDLDLREIDLVVIIEALEDMLKIFGEARYIQANGDDGNQMMNFRFF